MKLSWENISNLEEFYITYLLYSESKTVFQISKIRNISEDEVREQLITAKIKLRELKKNKTSKNNDILNNFLVLNKSDRLSFIDSLDDKKMVYFKRRLFERLLKEKNPEDLISLIWAIGELKDINFLKLLHDFTDYKHSDVRRITYSALRKIGSIDSKEFFEKGLYDSNPQTRQYCAKALKNVGDKYSLKIIIYLKNKGLGSEKSYVLRAYDEVIDTLKR